MTNESTSRFSPNYTVLMAVLVVGLLGLGGGLSVAFNGVTPLVTVGLVVAPLIVLLILTRPAIGLGLCILFAYTNLTIFTKGHLFLIIAIMTAMGWLMQQAMRGDIRIAGDQPNILVFGFASVAWMSIFFARDMGRSFEIFWGLMRAATIYFLVIQLVRDRLALRLTMWIVVLGTLLTVVAGVHDVFLGGGAWSNVQQLGAAIRTGSTMRDPNFWAMVLVGAIPFAVLVVRNEKAVVFRMVGAFCVVLFVAGVFFSFSRGGFLALMVVIALVALRQFRRPVVGIAILCLALAAFLLLLPRAFAERFKSLFLLLTGNIRGEASFQHRLILAKGALDIFLRYPIFGVGLGNFLMHASEYTIYPMVAHNMYLAVAAGTGVFGILLFLSIFGKAFLDLRGSQRIFAKTGQMDLANFAECVRISLIGLMIAGTFLSVPFKLELWITIGLAISLKEMSERLRKVDYSVDALSK